MLGKTTTSSERSALEAWPQSLQAYPYELKRSRTRHGYKDTQLVGLDYVRVCHNLQSLSIVNAPKHIREVACHSGLAAVRAFGLLTIALNLATSALIACPG